MHTRIFRDVSRYMPREMVGCCCSRNLNYRMQLAHSKIFSDFTGQYKKYMNEIFSLHGYLDLFDPRSLESKIEAVVAEASYFCVISIIAHTDDRDLGLLYQLYQFLFD